LLLVGEETAVAVHSSGIATEVRTDVAGTLPSLVNVVVSSAGSTCAETLVETWCLMSVCSRNEAPPLT